MGELTSDGIEACIAFASASIVVLELLGLGAARQDRLSDAAADLFVDLAAAHSRLRELFVTGSDAEVCGLALSVLVLADRTASALE